LSAVILVHKMYSDDYFENKHFSDISGISLQEINFLELNFLGIIEFNLVVNTEEYDQYLTALHQFFENEASRDVITKISGNIQGSIEGQMDKND
jgi:hypothetical protein